MIRWARVRWYRHPLEVGGTSWILALEGGGAVGWGEIRPLSESPLPFPDGLYPVDTLMELAMQGPPGYRFALECALWDAEARLRGTLLSREIPEGARVETHALVWLPTRRPPRGRVWWGEETEEVLWTQGYRVIKTKVHTLEDLAYWAAHPPHRMRLRIDANRSLPPERVQDLIPMLLQLPVDFVEEPFPPDALEGYRLLREAGIRIALDESLREACPVREERELWDVAVIKPALEGFWSDLQRRVRELRMQGIPVVLTHLLEGAVGRWHTLIRAFRLGIPGTHGLDTHRGSPLRPSHI